MADKRARFLQWLHSLPVVVDVVCIQEYHCVSLAECDLWFRSSGFPSVVSPGSKKSCGCVVLFRPTLSLVQSWADEEGRLLQCEFSFCDQSFCVILFYAPNRNPVRNQFLEQLADEVDPSLTTILIVLALTLLTPGERAPPHLRLSLSLVAALMPGGISILPLLVSLGPGQTAPYLLLLA